MQHCIKSSNSIVPFPWRSNFRTNKPTILSDKRYPNAVSAVFNSFWSIFPELSVSNERKQFCQSVTYFHKAPKSWKLTVPRFSRSNIPIIKRTGRKNRWLEFYDEIMTCYVYFIEMSHVISKTAWDAQRNSIFWGKEIKNLPVSGLKGDQVPLESACWSSSAEMCPLRSLSTLKII